MVETVFYDVQAWRIDTRDLSTARMAIKGLYAKGFRHLVKSGKDVFLLPECPEFMEGVDYYNCDDSLSQLETTLECVRDWSGDDV